MEMKSGRIIDYDDNYSPATLDQVIRPLEEGILMTKHVIKFHTMTSVIMQLPVESSLKEARYSTIIISVNNFLSFYFT